MAGTVSVFSPRQTDTNKGNDRKHGSVSVEEEEVVVVMRGGDDNTVVAQHQALFLAWVASLLWPVEDAGWSAAWLQITLQLETVETERKVRPLDSEQTKYWGIS